MDANCKPIHEHAYSVPRSIEQQLQLSKEFIRLVKNEVLEETIPLNGLQLTQNLKLQRKTNNKSSFQFQEAQLIFET
jgi:hypothetical protein